MQVLKEAVKAADLLLIVSPEYNHSATGVIKNALDWALHDRNALEGRPTAIMGASPSDYGSIRGQLALRQVLAGTATPVMPAPIVAVANVADKLNQEGALSDASTIESLEKFLAVAESWARRLNG